MCFIVLLWLLSPYRLGAKELGNPFSLTRLPFQLEAISFIVHLPAQSSQHGERGGGGEAC
jgi:hypothetical protein